MDSDLIQSEASARLSLELTATTSDYSDGQGAHPPLSWDDSRPQRVDERYRVDQEIGSGGMGTVFEGWDEQLHRKVAIKFLRSVLDTETNQKRFLREAQGLAQLSHPNVVAVYDFGRWNDRVWIAMEYVSGCTLGDWVKVSPRRSQYETIRHWLAAGRGLAAIHDAGMVHRDIKPTNALLGEDGRVRIIDFGLVKTMDDSLSAHGRIGTNRQTESGVGQHWTDTDTFVGTPAYAAPEAWDPSVVDPRSDQYSFAMAMWEGLCGSRPSRIDRWRGGLVPIPPNCRLPRRIHRALSRGLSIELDDRFPDMHALLAALEPRRSTWTSMVGVGAIAISMVGVAALVSGGDRAPEPIEPCTSSAQPVAKLWNADRRAEFQARVPPIVAAQALVWVDDWAREWGDVAETSCRDVHVHHLFSERILDRRSQCLVRQLRAFEALLDRGRQQPWSVVELGQWFAALPSPQECSAETVARRDYEAIPEQHRVEIASLERQMFTILGDTNASYTDKIDRLNKLEGRAEAIGWVPLMGELKLHLGRLSIKAYDIDRAHEYLGTALDIGVASDDLDLQSNAWSALLSIEIRVAHDIERSRWIWERERALLRDWSLTPRQKARLLFDEAQVLNLENKYEDAKSKLYNVLGLEPASALIGQRALAERLLGTILVTQGNADAAKEAHARAAKLESLWVDFPEHHTYDYSSASTQLFEVNALTQAGDFEKARALANDGLKLAIQEQGPQGELSARYHLLLAVLCRHLGDESDKRRHAELADEITTLSLGVSHPFRMETLSAVGIVALDEEQLDVAMRALRHSLVLAREHRDPESVGVAGAERNLAAVLLLKGRLEEAKPLAEHAAEVFANAWPNNISAQAPGWLILADIAEKQGSYAQAESYLDRVDDVVHLLNPKNRELYETIKQKMRN